DRRADRVARAVASVLLGRHLGMMRPATGDLAERLDGVLAALGVVGRLDLDRDLLVGQRALGWERRQERQLLRQRVDLDAANAEEEELLARRLGRDDRRAELRARGHVVRLRRRARYAQERLAPVGLGRELEVGERREVGVLLVAELGRLDD